MKKLLLINGFIIGLLSSFLNAENTCRVDVLGLGSAFVDYIIQVNDEDLETLNYEKGSWAPIEYQRLQEILEKHDTDYSLVAGGSSTNVIKGLANLGQSCAVIGEIGADDKAVFYVKSLEDLSIKAFMHQGTLPTGQLVSFVSPDGQRTMRSYFGASHTHEAFDLDKDLFKDIKLFHLESYQFENPTLLKCAIECAKRAGAKISIDLSSANIVKRFKDDLLNILPKYVDIVFANETEAFELTHLPPQEACEYLGSFCDIAIVTMGSRGSWTKSGKIQFYTPVVDVKVVDTTGAGDLFASGFLHGYLSGYPLQKSAWLGTLVASHVIQHYGAEIPNTEWKLIHQKILKEMKPSQLPAISE